MTKTMRDSLDTKVLKWSGLAMAAFLVGSLLTVRPAASEDGAAQGVVKPSMTGAAKVACERKKPRIAEAAKARS